MAAWRSYIWLRGRAPQPPLVVRASSIEAREGGGMDRPSQATKPAVP